MFKNPKVSKNLFFFFKKLLILKKKIFFFSEEKKIIFISQYYDYAIWPKPSSPAQSWEKIWKSLKKIAFFKNIKII